MQKKIYTILLLSFFTYSVLCKAGTFSDRCVNFAELNTGDDSITSTQQREKKLYVGMGTTTLVYLGGFVMQNYDGFIGYNISDKFSIENQFSYYHGIVKIFINWGDSYYSKTRFVSSNIRIKSKPFTRLPLFLSMGFKTEFNLYFHRGKYNPYIGTPAEATTINNKPRYWNNLYSFCLHYTIVSKSKYSIDVSLPVFFANSALGIYATNKKRWLNDRYATERLNLGLGLHVKF